MAARGIGNAFSFDAKVYGQKHSRLGRERVARFRYSLFFSICPSALSSAERAEEQIKRKSLAKRKHRLRYFARARATAVSSAALDKLFEKSLTKNFLLLWSAIKHFRILPSR